MRKLIGAAAKRRENGGVTQGSRLRAENLRERYFVPRLRVDRQPRCGCPLRLAGGKIGGTIFGKGKGLHRAVCVFSE
jgi:hypothetical protein